MSKKNSNSKSKTVETKTTAVQGSIQIQSDIPMPDGRSGGGRTSPERTALLGMTPGQSFHSNKKRVTLYAVARNANVPVRIGPNTDPATSAEFPLRVWKRAGEIQRRERKPATAATEQATEQASA